MSESPKEFRCDHCDAQGAKPEDHCTEDHERQMRDASLDAMMQYVTKALMEIAGEPKRMSNSPCNASGECAMCWRALSLSESKWIERAEPHRLQCCTCAEDRLSPEVWWYYGE